MFVRHRDIYDGQHHEDIRLQDDNQYVEDRPAEVQHAANDDASDPGCRPQPDQKKDDLARVHVAVEPQRMRKRLGNVLDQIEEQIENDEQRGKPERLETKRRSEQLVQPAAETLDLDAVE